MNYTVCETLDEVAVTLENLGNRVSHVMTCEPNKYVIYYVNEPEEEVDLFEWMPFSIGIGVVFSILWWFGFFDFF